MEAVGMGIMFLAWFALLMVGLLMLKRGWVISSFVLLGITLGVAVGFAVGVALGPGPEAGGMYGLEQLASGVVGGFWGLLAGAVLGGFFGWLVKERTGGDTKGSGPAHESHPAVTPHGSLPEDGSDVL